MSEFFGEPWPSGICDDGTRVATPIGVPCVECDEEVQDGDQGSWIWDMSEKGGELKPLHRECGLRQVLGSYTHLTMGDHKIGECNDVEVPWSKREDALKVWEWVKENGTEMHREFAK